MLSIELRQEMGNLIRSFEQRILLEATLTRADKTDAIEHLDRAIIALIAERLKLTDEHG
jgi:hypothetical protein